MADYISSHSGSQIDGAVDTVLNIQQTTGENTGYLMSQKAITDAITAAQPEIVQTTGTSTTAVMSQNAVTNMYNGKINVGGSLSLVGEDIQNTNNANFTSGVGSDIVISQNFGCSFGAYSQCNAEMGASIGAHAVCDEEFTVSVGEPDRTRRIVNVTDPINPQDVATKNYIDNRILSNALTIYVNSTSGSDNDDGSQSTPYATLTKAISILPKLIQGAVTINVAEGSYEFPNIFGFSGYGNIVIIGAGTSTIYTNAINIGYNSLSYIQIANAQFQYTPQSSESDKLYNNTGIIDLTGLTFLGTEGTPLTSPLRISSSANVLVNNCTFNYFDTAILTISATRCVITNLTCNNGTSAIGIYNGAIVNLVNDIFGDTIAIADNLTGAGLIYPQGILRKPIELYNNTSGTSSSITLDDDYSKFVRIGVYAQGINETQDSVYNEICTTINYMTLSSTSIADTNYDCTVWRTAKISFSGNILSFITNCSSSYSSTAGYVVSTSDGLKITRVVGYTF